MANEQIAGYLLNIHDLKPSSNPAEEKEGGGGSLLTLSPADTLPGLNIENTKYTNTL